MSADNDLERPAMKNLHEMEAVGSTDRVHIAVQVDRADRAHLLQRHLLARLQAANDPVVTEAIRALLDRLDDTSDGNWTGARRFHIQKDRSGREDRLASGAIDLGEIDMGEPQSLADFLRWGTTEFPARRYALVLWGHGSGIAPFERLIDQVLANFGQYASILHGTRTVALDNTDGDQLEVDEVVSVLESSEMRGLLARGRATDRLDLLGFDACLMGQMEVWSPLASRADVLVGSESLVPVAGWAYSETLEWLAGEARAGRSPDARALAVKLVDRTIPIPSIFEVIGKAVAGFFIRLFGGQVVERQITLSALTSGKLAALERTVDDLAGRMALRVAAPRASDFLRAVAAAKDGAQTFLFEQFIDLFHFAELLGRELGSDELAGRIGRGLDPAASVELSRREGSLNEEARGLSIFFPVIDYSLIVPDDWYDQTAFARSNRWREFVRSFRDRYRALRLGINAESIAARIDAGEDERREPSGRADRTIPYLTESVTGDLFVAAVAEQPWKASALTVPLVPYRTHIREDYPAVRSALAEIGGYLAELEARYGQEPASGSEPGWLAGERAAEVRRLRQQVEAIATDSALPPAAVLAAPTFEQVLFGTFTQEDVRNFLVKDRSVSKNPWNWQAGRYKRAVLKALEYWDSVLGGLADRTDPGAVRTREQLRSARALLAARLPRKDDRDAYWHYPPAATLLLEMWSRFRSDHRLESLIATREPVAPSGPATPDGAGSGPGSGQPAPPAASGAPPPEAGTPAPPPRGPSRPRAQDPADADRELGGR
jgi:hypothetical protein